MIKRLSQVLSLSIATLSLVGCTTSTQIDGHIPSHSAHQILHPVAQTPPSIKKWLQQPPYDYILWLNQGDHRRRVTQYQQFLKAHNVDDVVPMYQLLRSARDWQKCGGMPYAVPSAELWQNALPTIKVLALLVDSGILQDFEVTSVYRDYSVNLCAGGAAGSKHVYNAALDFRLGPESMPSDEDLLSIAHSKTKLCAFWRNYGQSLNLGLGVYASGQIHIDTQGYRTWGPDLTRNSSICQN
jgi:hypothetical protein